MGKIAYGRRRTEKKQGTRNEMHVVEQSEFPVYEGQHEAITVSYTHLDVYKRQEGYIQRKADASISSKDFYEIYRMWCEENSLAPLKARSFSAVSYTHLVSPST